MYMRMSLTEKKHLHRVDKRELGGQVYQIVPHHRLNSFV